MDSILSVFSPWDDSRSCLILKKLAKIYALNFTVQNTNLYNYFFLHCKIHSDARKAPIFQLYKKKYSADNSTAIITFKGLIKFLQDYLFEDFEPSFLPADLEFSKMERFLVIFKINCAIVRLI